MGGIQFFQMIAEVSAMYFNNIVRSGTIPSKGGAEWRGDDSSHNDDAELDMDSAPQDTRLPGVLGSIIDYRGA